MLNKTLEMEHNRHHSYSTNIRRERLHLRDTGSRTSTRERYEPRRIQQQDHTPPTDVQTPDFQLRRPRCAFNN